jgi:hypothetical protein
LVLDGVVVVAGRKALVDCETAPIVKVVAVPALTLFRPENGTMPTLVVLELAGCMLATVAAVGGVVVTVLLADVDAPSLVVTVTWMLWTPGSAGMETNTADRVCFGSSGPRAWTC